MYKQHTGCFGSYVYSNPQVFILHCAERFPPMPQMLKEVNRIAMKRLKVDPESASESNWTLFVPQKVRITSCMLCIESTVVMKIKTKQGPTCVDYILLTWSAVFL
jgi:hypothetical protein